MNSKKMLEKEIDVHLEEYKDLRSQIESRVSHQNNLFNWAIGIFAGLNGIIFGFPSGISELAHLGMQWLVLLVPLIFLTIAFDYQSQYFMMANLAAYINNKLRPKIALLLSTECNEIFEWEDYLGCSRMKSGLIENLSWNSRYFLIISMAIAWWLFYFLAIFVHLKILWGIGDTIFSIVNVIIFLLIIYSNVHIYRKFRRVVEGN